MKNEKTDSMTNRFEGKRLMRDLSNRMLGGVCSGLARYVGGDPTLWRIGAVLLALFANVWVLIVYVAMWIVVPVDRSVPPQSGNGCLKAFFFALLLVPLMFVLVPLMLLAAMMLGFVGFGLHGLMDTTLETMSRMLAPAGIMLWIYLIGAAVLLVLLVFIVSRWTKGERQGLKWWIAVLVLIPLIALASTWCIALGKSVKQWFSSLPIQSVEWAEQAEPGQGMSAEEYLKSWDWHLIVNNGEGSVGSGEYYDGTPDYSYLEGRAKEDKPLLYTAEQCDSTLEGGTYSLTAAVRADAPGAYVYVRIGASARHPEEKPLFERMLPVRAFGRSGGKMPDWEEDAKGWTLRTIHGIPLKAGQTIYYGITTDPRLTHAANKLTWFSACDFELVREP